jgi:nucleoid-associated protein YgaU
VAEGESYVVAEGDTLATIADKFYGDSSQWRRIYDANRSAIGENPDAVRIGTTLRIPPKQ